MALALVWVLLISCSAPFAGAAASAQTEKTTTTLDTRGTSVADTSAAPIDPALTKASGTVTVVVRMEEANPSVSADRAAAIDTLRTHAERSQRPVLSYAKRHPDSVTVLNRLWITNAVVLRVDKSTVDLKKIAMIDGVTQLHENFELTLPKPVDSSADDTPVGMYGANASDSAESSEYNTTYGLDQINATDVWDAYGTKGTGVKVAVLDTGVDVDHPDIDLYTENESDPTYPGGWAEFDSDGNRVQGSVPHDTDTHGTHTSGTVSGGSASGEYIGVAPNVSLMHGLILPSGSGSFTQVAAGMQWAVEQDADVISMSLGATGYYSQMIDPVRNAEAAGTIVVAAAGNSGEGTSGSPGNVYESFAIGASNENRGIASFSSGEEVDTANDWGSDAPDSWPDSYVVPDVSAPGVDVKSSVPGGGYAEYSGTSMATPHTAGAVALMIAAAGGDLQPSRIRSAFRETATKPESCSPSCSPRDGNDTRYGAGIIDVKAASDLVALESGITGTVTNQSGAPIAGASVSLGNGHSTVTNASGGYTLLEEPGTYDVTVDAFGYQPTTATVDVENETFTDHDVSLSPALGVRLLDGQSDAVEGGDSVTVTAAVRNLDTYTADLTGDYDTANATLLVNGEEHPFGQAIDMDGYSGELNVTVRTKSGTHGSFSLAHTFEGMGDSVEKTTGPTNVFEEFTTIAVVDSDEGYGDQTAAALDASLPANYQVTVVQDENAMDAVGEYDSFVMQDFDPAQLDAQAFVDATNSPSTGVVWLEQWGDASDTVTSRSAAVGDPASTDDEGFGAGNPYFTITKSSPLFEGVGSVGDNVTVHTGSWGDHAWYSGYSGTTVATVGDDDGTKGSAIGVDRQTGTVLASSLGRTSYVGNDDYTEEADLILANAVQYVSTAPAVVVKSGQPRHVNPGEEVQVNLSVNQLRDIEVDLSENSTLSEDDLSLYIDGWGPLPFGLPILERPPETTDDYTITVVPDEDAVGSFSLETTATAGPTRSGLRSEPDRPPSTTRR
ncbi:S8 family serine peptidase [Haladaptatus sp. R4]|uniref:S8 family serine peptidase n=1 Tax=Haladaptatus sp. R4 TaxID=1679489 RepID=UPI000A65B4AA|nr:S8 family serine peptidase [Haladaptatus sp. R4]